MTSVILAHAVGNMETWLAGGPNRKPALGLFCKSYRLFRHTEDDRVSVLCEGVDLDRMYEVLDSPEAARAEEADTVILPLEIYTLIDGAE